ncbi:MAG: fucose isomerase, partial [SAR324 cluster bacterium]|nr:fucose isomerase [SAR324 cluster bacterium]
MSSQKIALFWPGDYRPEPNESALPNMKEATVQIENALKKLGRRSYHIDGFITRPNESIHKLGPIDDPMIGICVHWIYGPNTVD